MSPKVRRGYDAAGVRAVLLAGTAVFVTIVAPRPAVAADLDNTTPYENSTSFAGNVTGNSSTIAEHVTI